MSIHHSQPRKYNWWLFGLSVLFIAYVVYIGLQLPTDTEPTRDGALALSLLFAGVAAGGYGVSIALPDIKWFAWTPCLGALAMSAFMFTGAILGY